MVTGRPVSKLLPPLSNKSLLLLFHICLLIDRKSILAESNPFFIILNVSHLTQHTVFNRI